MLAQSSDELPAGRAWTSEVKWDGYRAVAVNAGGADVRMSLRTTAAVDVVGRTLRKIGTLELGPSSADPRLEEFQLRPGANLHILLGSAGIRIDPVANLLLSANVLFPLTSRGLTDNLTWLLRFDYSF